MELDYKVPGGKLIRLSAELDGTTIKTIQISGDFFLHPEDAIFELETALVGKELDKVTLQKLIAEQLSGCEMVGISTDELVTALLKLS